MKTSRGIRKRLAGKIRLLPAAAGGLILVLGLAEIQAQPPVAAEAREVEGRVERLTTAPRGEIDGAMLDNGKWLHWPPHLAERFANIIKAGDQVQAKGRMETGKRGDSRFEIQTVTNLRSGTTVENSDYANGPPAGRRGKGKREPAADASISTECGIVKRLTTAKKGETDGAVLENGTWLHWPPHLGDRFSAVFKAGDQVQATGRLETGKKGDSRFEVQSVTNQHSNTSVDNPNFIDGRSARPADAARVAPDGPLGRDQRLRELQTEVDRLQREIERLRRDK